MPIHLIAHNDMGHFTLTNRDDSNMIAKFELYSLINDDITTTTKFIDGYGYDFYKTNFPQKSKEYKLDGQTYVVDFSHLY